LFKNPNLESRDELTIEVKDENGASIYRQYFAGFNFGDTSHARLDFAAIRNSVNKLYFIEISLTKVVDGKLAFGTKNNQLDVTQYYYLG
jgi:hypothetical protein